MQLLPPSCWFAAYKKQRGFTLVELLVASALFLIIGTVLISSVSAITAIWQQGIARNERRNAALTVFSLITQDLRTAAIPTDLNGANLQFVVCTSGSNVSGITMDGGYTLPQATFWQTPERSNPNGNIAVVGYFVQWLGNSPKLTRYYATPLSSGSAYQLYNSSALWMSDQQLNNYAKPDKTHDYEGLVAENVLGLWIQPRDQTWTPITQYATFSGSGTTTGIFPPGQFDSRKGYLTTGTSIVGGTNYILGTTPMGLNSSGNPTPPTLIGALPASLEVIIIAIDSRTALRLAATDPNQKPSNRTANVWDDVNTFYNGLPANIRKGAEIYSTVIDLANSPR